MASFAVLLSTRLLYLWIRSRAQVQLVELRQRGTSERVRALPPGSVVTELRHGEELRFEIGPADRNDDV
ncbi:hypothetical protein V2W30_01690 [Streptomyces sp. Q6]|uniref:Uncharacterized protein n=1 Tax=Streptomyces citrinus TaxID=3118173 RepID=A0ACD5A4T0_9ACTN